MANIMQVVHTIIGVTDVPTFIGSASVSVNGAFECARGG